MAQTIEPAIEQKVRSSPDAGVYVKVRAEQRQTPTENICDHHGGIEYHNVLCNLVTEPREPVIHDDTINGFFGVVQEPSDVGLRSWKCTLPLKCKRKPSRSDKETPSVFNLKSDGIVKELEILMTEFGRGTNSSFLDDTYSIYLPEDEKAAICFKVIQKVAVMYGDPLCAVDRVDHVFQTFCSFCERRRWRVAVVGAGPTLTTCAKNRRWATMEFAVEKILNPMANSVLDGTSGKTIRRTNRRLITNGVKLCLYEPCKGVQARLEQELMEVYNSWREDRRKRDAPQAYSAIINPFAMSNVTRYLYTTGSSGKPNSLAGLIRLGAVDGYLLEPCIQLPDAPKGVTGFLVTHAMGLLRDEGVTYMTFGLEALPALGEITLLPSFIRGISRVAYRITFNALDLRGRQVFHESFHPERDQHVPLYLLFPPGLPSVAVYQAVLDATHISPREVWNRLHATRPARRKHKRNQDGVGRIRSTIEHVKKVRFHLS